MGGGGWKRMRKERRRVRIGKIEAVQLARGERSEKGDGGWVGDWGDDAGTHSNVKNLRFQEIQDDWDIIRIELIFDGERCLK